MAGRELRSGLVRSISRSMLRHRSPNAACYDELNRSNSRNDLDKFLGIGLKLLPLVRRYQPIALAKKVAIAYICICLCLWGGQRHLMFHPDRQLVAVPSNAPWKMPYQEVVIPSGTGTLKGWWISADPRRTGGSKAKVILFLGGAAGNKSHYLDRVEGLRQLGFSLLLFDYRGYGESAGDLPSETQLYQDSQAAWNYLIDRQQIPADRIFIYGESLGGAIAIDLALKQPQAAGAIVQSSFTSMPEMAKWKGLGWLVPIDLLANEKFDSVAKVRSLQMPVLFVHGTADETVPVAMSQQLFAAAPAPKYLHIVPTGEHARLYKPGEHSYLTAIRRFIDRHDREK
jgi:uncharacterized protein